MQRARSAHAPSYLALVSQVTRFALGIQYDGRPFSGWQRQRDVRTVQEELETSLSRVADEEVRVYCAGRTDRGVHAIEQVVHFETLKTRPDRAWQLGTNANLPSEIAVSWVKRVPEDFHARFSALSRTYQYIILNQRARPALWSGKVSWEFEALDVEKMQLAANYWLGEHDFSSFRAAGCQSKTPFRCVEYFRVERRLEYVVISVCANAFLQHMVRNFVGVLVEIGRCRKDPAWALEVLNSKRREAAGKTASPDGLYLVAVKYPELFQMPSTTCSFPPVLSFR